MSATHRAAMYATEFVFNSIHYTAAQHLKAFSTDDTFVPLKNAWGNDRRITQASLILGDRGAGVVFQSWEPTFALTPGLLSTATFTAEDDYGNTFSLVVDGLKYYGISYDQTSNAWGGTRYFFCYESATGDL